MASNSRWKKSLLNFFHLEHYWKHPLFSAVRRTGQRLARGLRQWSHSLSKAATATRLSELLLIAAAVASIGLLIVVPLASVFVAAFANGPRAWWEAIAHDPDTRHAIWLSLTVAPVAVAFNTIFGIAAAWLVARFRFPGRTLLVSLFDVPFSVSPVVAGLALVLIFGRQGLFGPTLATFGAKVIFAWPGLVLATTFVTLPMVVRELIPVMEAIGPEEELAAVSLGANGWQVFWRITLPNIRWALLHGIVLANARAMGEFGAVYVVSGHIAGATDTMPLRVEKLFQEYRTPASMAVASVLAGLALVTLVAKVVIERQLEAESKELEAARASDAGTDPTTGGDLS
ncbi:MAG: sulfate ABC transporter permease subunit CysW [Planctomycetota bacterium]|nr:MAG: sulfate ABC transporter permease subunit CysW [Planctomycetota bacterium]